MPLLLQCKNMFKKLLSFVNNLPRLHFWAIIALFFFLLFVSLVPPNHNGSKKIKKELTLPISDSLKGEYAVAAPLNEIRNNSDKLFPDFSGNREVEVTISAGDTLSEIFSNESLSGAVLQELLEADTEYLRLANLIPGQVVQLLISPDNQLLALKVIVDRANTLNFVLKDGVYTSNLEIKEGEWRNSFYQGSVTGSFYVSAKKSGLYLSYTKTNSRKRGVFKPSIATGKGSCDFIYDIVPGHPEESILIYRMKSNDPSVRMPEIGRSIVHTEGLNLLERYIKELAQNR